MERFINRAVTVFLIILIGVILGYGWRMLHENKNYESWKSAVQKEFVMNMFYEAAEGRSFIYEKILIVKPRKDDALVIRIKNEQQ